MCPNNFNARTKNDKYCSRKCFEKNYFKKEKQFPVFKCSHCGESMQLDFMPTKKRKQFEEFKCPKCGVANQDGEDDSICF